MALSGIQIYKLLPGTNCKECGYPTCLAFAMKLAAKQVELSDCPHVSEEAQSKLAESAAPPIRLVTITANGHNAQAGNEVVLFRHEKTFYNKPGIFVRLRDDDAPEVQEEVITAAAYSTNYVGRDLAVDGVAVEARSGDAASFAAAVADISSRTNLPLILMSRDTRVLAKGLPAASAQRPLLFSARADNWQEMATLAKEHDAPLAISAPTLDALEELVENVRSQSIDDIVLSPTWETLDELLALSTQIRRLALKNVRAMGYPVLAIAADVANTCLESIAAAQAICKYAGFVVTDLTAPADLYPLLVLRENIYTDPQKPIQVQPGLYEINGPQPGDPLLVTTNFSITYFSVANEVEASGLPAWLLVTDAEGMSVLTAWAAGNFDAERIAKDVKQFGVVDKVTHRQIVIPGQVAVISGELEEELPGWDVRVGPREAVDLPAFIKNVLSRQPT